MQTQTTDTARGSSTIAPSSPKQIPVGPGAAPQPTAEAQDLQQIREAAYAMYEARGCAEGHELDDWLQAEQRVQRSRTDAGQPAASDPAH